MRSILPLAALLALLSAPASAHAEEWCGFHDKAGAMVRCGYSSLEECRQHLGEKAKDIVCMPSPSFADERRKSTSLVGNG